MKKLNEINDKIIKEQEDYIKLLKEISKDKDLIIQELKKQLSIHGVVGRSEQLECDNGCDWYSVGHQLNGHQECRKCGKQKAF
jgi:transcription initiation factor IIE alpha subunit